MNSPESETGKVEEHVFGPVPSRRLGRSLGVDLVPYKVCSFDCVYCQVGRTTHKTTERRVFVPVERIVTEVRDRLAAREDVRDPLRDRADRRSDLRGLFFGSFGLPR